MFDPLRNSIPAESASTGLRRVSTVACTGEMRICAALACHGRHCAFEMNPQTTLALRTAHQARTRPGAGSEQ